jgi:hypothetical protein
MRNAAKGRFGDIQSASPFVCLKRPPLKSEESVAILLRIMRASLHNNAVDPIIIVGPRGAHNRGRGAFRMPGTVQTRERARRRLAWPLVFLMALLVTAGAWAIWASRGVSPEEGAEVRVRVVLPDGASASKIAAILKEDGLIRSSVMFDAMARFSGKDSSLKAGNMSSYRAKALPAF